MKNICELIKTKYPIIQGAMAHITDGKLASAVSNAGGLGIIAASDNDAKWVSDQIDLCRSLTDKPFGVNIMLMNPHAKAIAEVLIEKKVAVVTTGAGNPASYIPEFKKHGIIVLPVVPTVALALRMERSGADGVIVEGCEAGGHIGNTTTMCLVPQAADALSIPVIAAGGIADSRGVVAAFALGAKGIQVGTVILASTECSVHQNYKDLIINANDNDTIISGLNPKMRVRVLKSQLSLAEAKIMSEDILEYETKLLGSLKRAVNGDLETGSFMAGQIAGLIKAVKPLAQIFDEMFNEANNLVKMLKII